MDDQIKDAADAVEETVEDHSNDVVATDSAASAE